LGVTHSGYDCETIPGRRHVKIGDENFEVLRRDLPQSLGDAPCYDYVTAFPF
jgi:hypothetical protein